VRSNARRKGRTCASPRRTGVPAAAVVLVCCLAVLWSAPTWANDWTDGFNGSVGNWSLRTGTAMTYSTAQSHNTYTGAGCMAHPTASSEMYRSTGSRPYHAGIATACHYDSVRWRAGYCGNTYRQLLGIAGPTYGTYQLAVGHYSSGSTGDFFRRDSGGNYTSIGAKGARSNCAGGWIYFEIECQANGDVYRRADDGVVNRTHTRARSSTEINAGIGMVTIGLGASSANVGYWDDIRWDGYDPGMPTGIAATANSTSQITWTASAASDNNQFGFALMDGTTEKVVSSTTARQSSASLAETGLSANTSYTRAIRAWNGNNNSANSSTLSKYTLIETPATPTFGTVTDNSIVLNTSGLSGVTRGTSGVYFDETTETGDGGINAWVQATTDTATGLAANTQYTFQARARNGDSVVTAYSGTASKYTLQYAATTPTFSSVTTTGFRVNTTGPANLTSGSSGVVFHDGTADRAKVTELYDDVTDLSPNTQYTFKAKGVNGDSVATAYSGTASTWTLSVAPTSGSVTPDVSNVCAGSPVTWTAQNGGFVAGNVHHYRYVFNTSDSHTFDGDETAWSSGTLATVPTTPGTWYLHVKGYNGADVGNGQFYYQVTVNPASVGGRASSAP